MGALAFLCLGLGYRYGQRNAKNGIASPLVVPASEVTGKESASSSSVDFSLFWDVWDLLGRNYLDKKVVNPEKMIYGAISGMVSSLGDPYTMFLPPSQNKEAKDDLNGALEGIGAQLGMTDKKIVIIAPLKGSPAEAAGLKPGDWIQKVDGKETYDWTIQDAISKIRGDKGTSVTLQILPKDASSSSQVTIKRDAIHVASVEWELKNVQCLPAGEAGTMNNSQCSEVKENCPTCKKIAYLKLTRFGDETDSEWEKAITEIVQKTASLSQNEYKGVILDVRNNPGGYLNGAVFIGSEFLKDGAVVIQENADGSRDTLAVNRVGKLLTVPMTVLINKGSASASEIVAGALQDRKRATLVGDTSFGKGTVQQAMDLKAGAGIHITTAKWLLPGGKWIHGIGLTPDVKVLNDDSKPDEDMQLEKAFESLIK